VVLANPDMVGRVSQAPPAPGLQSRRPHRLPAAEELPWCPTPSPDLQHLDSSSSVTSRLCVASFERRLRRKPLRPRAALTWGPRRRRRRACPPGRPRCRRPPRLATRGASGRCA
jgi:hypothetical protein